MESSEYGRLDDAAVGVGGRGDAARDLLREPLMRTLSVEVAGIVGEQAFEVAVAEDENVIEAVAPYAPEDSLADSVRSRLAERGAQHADACPGGDPVEDGAELRVAITEKEARRLPSASRCAVVERPTRHSAHG